jgi:predicted RNA-binding Zn-ribbon protein involved in translation (DUF1610 family)
MSVPTCTTCSADLDPKELPTCFTCSSWRPTTIGEAALMILEQATSPVKHL